MAAAEDLIDFTDWEDWDLTQSAPSIQKIKIEPGSEDEDIFTTNETKVYILENKQSDATPNEYAAVKAEIMGLKIPSLANQQVLQEQVSETEIAEVKARGFTRAFHPHWTEQNFEEVTPPKIIQAPIEVEDSNLASATNKQSSSTVVTNLREDPSANNLFVYGLGASVGGLWLKYLFSRYGYVNQVQTVVDKQRRSLGCAFVKMHNVQGARAAMNGLQDFVLNAFPLQVKTALEIQKFTNTQIKGMQVQGPEAGFGELSAVKEQARSVTQLDAPQQQPAIRDPAPRVSINLPKLSQNGKPDISVPNVFEKTEVGDSSHALPQPDIPAFNPFSLGFKRDPSILYIGNLDALVGEDYITRLFAKRGNVEKVHIIFDAKHQTSRGIGYVKMENAASASQAMKDLQGQMIMGHPLDISSISQLSSDGQQPSSRHPSSKVTTSDQSTQQLDTPSTRKATVSNIAQSPSEAPPTNDPCELFVENLDYSTTSDHLKAPFPKHSYIEKAKRHRDYGYVKMNSAKSARAAAKALEGYHFVGDTLKIGDTPPAQDGDRLRWSTNKPENKLVEGIGSSEAQVSNQQPPKVQTSPSLLFFKNLDPGISQGDLCILLVKYGFVQKAQIINGGQCPNNVSMGLAVVKMGSDEAGIAALEGLQGQQLNGHQLEVSNTPWWEEADPKHTTSPTDLRIEPLTEQTANPGMLFFRHLAPDVTQADLALLFVEYGYVKSLRITYGDKTNKSRGYGVIHMGSEEEAHAALVGLQGQVLRGQTLKLYNTPFKPKELHETFSAEDSENDSLPLPEPATSELDASDGADSSTDNRQPNENNGELLSRPAGYLKCDPPKSSEYNSVVSQTQGIPSFGLFIMNVTTDSEAREVLSPHDREKILKIQKWDHTERVLCFQTAEERDAIFSRLPEFIRMHNDRNQPFVQIFKPRENLRSGKLSPSSKQDPLIEHGPQGRQLTCWYWKHEKCNNTAENCKFLHRDTSNVAPMLNHFLSHSDDSPSSIDKKTDQNLGSDELNQRLESKSEVLKTNVLQMVQKSLDKFEQSFELKFQNMEKSQQQMFDHQVAANDTIESIKSAILGDKVKGIEDVYQHIVALTQEIGLVVSKLEQDRKKDMAELAEMKKSLTEGVGQSLENIKLKGANSKIKSENISLGVQLTSLKKLLDEGGAKDLELGKLVQAKAHLVAQYSALLAENNSLNAETYDLKKNWGNQKDNQDMEVGKLIKQTNDMKSEIGSLKAEIQSLKMLRKTVGKTNKAIIEQLQKDNKNLTAQLEGNGGMDGQDPELEVLRGEIETLRTEIMVGEVLREENESLKAEVWALNSDRLR